LKRWSLIIVALSLGAQLLFSQPRNFTPTDISGQIQLTATTNLQALAAPTTPLSVRAGELSLSREKGAAKLSQSPEKGRGIPLLRPPQLSRALSFSALSSSVTPSTQALTVGPTGSFGFNGMTHLDQRLANNGNQFSVEPPNTSIAVANGYVLEGVNNAVQVYSTNGTPLLPSVLSSNQVFGLGPAINRNTNVFGVFPTDMHVFYDQSINRWFIVQRAQDEDVLGNPLPSSHLYIAVSQTGDPTQNYKVYTMDSTNASNFDCPCIFDYPQLGADQNAFYISGDEFTPFFTFVDAAILAISKASLAAGAQSPPAARFLIPLSSGFEFAIQPAVTPPGGSYFVANISQGGAGLEYFVSSQGQFGFDSNLAVWAMTNTSFIDNPSMINKIGLTESLFPTLSYTVPDVANQKPGPPGSRPLGEGMTPPGPLELIDGGDTRVQSTSYVAGRLWVTLATELFDNSGNRVIGVAYFVLSPTFRSGVLNSSILREGYLLVPGNHLLRPAWAVNAQGSGALVCTLVGPSYFPSTAFLPFSLTSTSSVLQLSGAGTSPEDGFTGYTGSGQVGVARWGDTSSAAVDNSGVIWLGAEYISSEPRTPQANWATFITKYTGQ